MSQDFSRPYLGILPADEREPLPSPFVGAGRNLALFLLTIASVWLVGGARQAIGLMSILLAHEMGHYLACRYYGVDATLPYFIPFPFHMAGTFGAFIRIRSPFPHRKALFDIGIAGPLAGFVVCLPVLLLGVMEAQVVASPSGPGWIEMGEPLLFQWATRLVWGELHSGSTLVIGPLGMSAWFGLLVTALNLMPVGQLDGGHVTYALTRRLALPISQIGMLLTLVLLYLHPTWLVWSVLLFVLARPHPPTLDDTQPIGRGRVIVGIAGLLVFVVCFTPHPVYVSWAELFEGLSELYTSLTGR